MQMEHFARRSFMGAESINSKMTDKERKKGLADLSCKAPEMRFLFVNPEQVVRPYQSL
jgi:hypothetical protein